MKLQKCMERSWYWEEKENRLCSFRRFTNRVNSDHINQSRSLTILNHSITQRKSRKEEEFMLVNVRKSLHFQTIQRQQQVRILINIIQKEKEIQLLRQHNLMNTDAITNLSDQLTKVMQEIKILKEIKIVYFISMFRFRYQIVSSYCFSFESFCSFNMYCLLRNRPLEYRG